MSSLRKLITADSIGTAPVDASYVLLTLDDDLASERKLEFGAGIDGVDTGGNGTLTIVNTGVLTPSTLTEVLTAGNTTGTKNIVVSTGTRIDLPDSIGSISFTTQPDLKIGRIAAGIIGFQESGFTRVQISAFHGRVSATTFQGDTIGGGSGNVTLEAGAGGFARIKGPALADAYKLFLSGIQEFQTSAAVSPGVAQWKITQDILSPALFATDNIQAQIRRKQVGNSVTSTEGGVLFEIERDITGTINGGGTGLSLMMRCKNAGATVFSIDKDGNVFIGAKLTVTGLIDPTGVAYTEVAAVPFVTAPGFGTMWVKSDTPNKIIFTGDDGVDHDILAEIAAAATSPGGADTQVQFNDGGVFGGDVDLTWVKATNRLSLNLGGGSDPFASLPGITVFGEDSSPAIQLIGHGAGVSNGVIRIGQAAGTRALPTIVADETELAQFVGVGYDGASFRESARIRMVVDGATGAGSMPGRIQFETAVDGAGSATEKMRLTRWGSLIISDDPSANISSSPAGGPSVELHRETGSVKYFGHAWGDATVAPHFIAVKAAGTRTTPVAVASGDLLYKLQVQARDTNGNAIAAEMRVECTGAPTSTAPPTRFAWHTQDGTTLLERMRLDDNTTVSETALMLSVAGAAAIRVSVGAADSGGAGFREVLVPN